MTDFSENYFTAKSQQLRTQCKVPATLPEEEQFLEWRKYWRVQKDSPSQGTRKTFRVEVKIDCEFHDVPSLGQVVEGWSERGVEEEADKVIEEWLLATYDWAFG